jgi:hypothetical protein
MVLIHVQGKNSRNSKRLLGGVKTIQMNKKLICDHAFDCGFLCDCNAAVGKYGRKFHKKWFCKNTRQEVQWVYKPIVSKIKE